MIYRKKRMTLMSKYRFLMFMLFLVNLTTLNQGSADGVIKNVVISLGIDQDRRKNAFRPMYHWEFDSENYTIKIEIDGKSYNKLRHHKKGRYRKQIENLVSIVEEASETLGPLVGEFRRIMPSSWSDERRINFVLAFVQCLPYTKDEVSTGLKEYYRYPVETLVDSAVEEKGVDCEDTSVLLASILKPLGYKVALLLVPRHIAVGVKGPLTATRFWNNRYNSSDYFFCETTGQGWRLGQVPEKFQGIQATVMQISLPPSNPKKIVPRTTPKPRPTLPLSPQENLQKGIELYEQARYNEAIIFLRSALLGLNEPKQRAKAHLYMGCSKRGFGEADDNVIGEFQKALRHDPNQKLPPRIGEDHPVFKPMLEKAREKITGKLTITASPPQAKIWIDGSLLKRKMLGAGTASIRLFEGTYTVEGIFEKLSKSETVRIRPGGDKKLHLKILPIVKHDPPARVATNQTIPLTLHVISTEKLRHVEVHYTIYDLHNIKLERGSKEMLISRAEPKSFTWSYRVNLHSPSQAGKIMYFVKTGKERTPKTGHHQILVQSIQPEIVEIEPLEGAQFSPSETITVKAKVKPVVSIEEVRVYYDSSRTQLSEASPFQLLEYRPFSGTYVGEIPMTHHRNKEYIWYFVTASNVDGRKTKSEVRAVKIRTLKVLTREKIPPPEIAVLEPRAGDSFNFNQTIKVKAKVKSSVSIREVRVYYDSTRTQLSENSPFRPLFQLLDNKSSLDTYAGKIPTGHSQKEGYLWYFVEASTAEGQRAKSEVRSVRVKRRRPIAKDKKIEKSKIIAGRDQKPPVKPIDEKKPTEPPPRPPREHKLRSPLHQGVWASHSWSSYVQNDTPLNSDWTRGDVINLAYLSEGKGFQTIGARLDFPYENSVNTSAALQWGPALKDSHITFALLAGVAGYRSSDADSSRARQSTEITPLLGGSLKFYPLDRAAIDLTGSMKLRSANGSSSRETDFTRTHLYHYEMEIRLYITPSLNLKAGYGRWRLGEHDNTSVQIGIGNTF